MFAHKLQIDAWRCCLLPAVIRRLLIASTTMLCDVYQRQATHTIRRYAYSVHTVPHTNLFNVANFMICAIAHWRQILSDAALNVYNHETLSWRRRRRYVLPTFTLSLNSEKRKYCFFLRQIMRWVCWMLDFVKILPQNSRNCNAMHTAALPTNCLMRNQQSNF